MERCTIIIDLFGTTWVVKTSNEPVHCKYMSTNLTPAWKKNKCHPSYPIVVLPLKPPQSGQSIERANGHQWRDYGPKFPSLFAVHASQDRRRILYPPKRKYRSTHLRISSSLNCCLNIICLSSVNIAGQVFRQCAIRIMPSNFFQSHIQYGCILLSKRWVYTSFILNCFL